MPRQALASRVDGGDLAALDLLGSAARGRELPGVRVAFDSRVMERALHQALLDGSPRYRIDRCEPGHASAVPGDGCVVRYDLEVADTESGRRWRPLVSAHLFATVTAARRYHDERLAPLAERSRGREELEPFVRPVAVLGADLKMAVSAFPIDGELPALVEATDPERVAEVARRAVPELASGPLAVRRCRVSRGHYGRRHRCVLRYELDCIREASGASESVVLFGKVAADGRGAVGDAAITALRERMQGAATAPFAIPRSFGFHPELQLLLLEAVPGTREAARLLEEHVRSPGPASPVPDAVVDQCARVAATLHRSHIGVGRQSSAGAELARLGEAARALARVSPELGRLLTESLSVTEAFLAASPPLDPCLSHGDFRPGQLLFDGGRWALVDFDTICQAEPALDLGHFQAYVRLVAAKMEPVSPGAATAAAELCDRLLSTYVATFGPSRRDEVRLYRRAAGYEAISLVRLALHSWQKFKADRLAAIIPLLEERVSWLARSG